ncbi:N-acetylmuramoyl-L-alanine amidase [Thioclava sp. BHET1]|nr:N-acetylmuramoyl-L-alanine amidase [Thioclava sp. BHET1]
MPGWSRLVLALDGPYRVAKAEMATRAQQGEAVVGLQLVPESAADFQKDAQAAVPQDWALPKPAKIIGVPRPRQDGHRPLVVVLDPGHGGIDPGSVYGHVDEKQITLSFGLELRDLLLAHGIQVVMTRTSDVFVPLEDRLSIARAAHADLFIAIHADAETSHEAVGATVYTLSTKATDHASAELAARHDRDDIMAGVDLSDTDDVIAKVLMSMARTENMPRSEAFAGDLVASIKADGIRMHRRPHQEAAFSVLKSPDVPSVLVELGYLSSPSDRRNLLDPAWRKRMAAAMLQAIRKWAKEDAAQALLLRQ